LAVRPAHAGRGAGKLLVRTALEAARVAGHGIVLLVGDEPYYGPLGFVRLKPGSVQLPGPVDPSRLLAAELQPGALAGLSGMVTKAYPPARTPLSNQT
jgi:predicted N-acetyltransferase YhbS